MAESCQVHRNRPNSMSGRVPPEGGRGTRPAAKAGVSVRLVRETLGSGARVTLVPVSCAFCGRIDQSSREHVIPGWLSRKLSNGDDGWFEYRRGDK